MRFTCVDTAASRYNGEVGYMCLQWLSLYSMSLHLSACDFLVCLLAHALGLCVYHGASVCNAAANSLWLNHKLRAMRECCQFSTGEGLIHSVSDAINQIKHPSALLEEFLWSTYDSRECQIEPEMNWSNKQSGCATRDYTATTYSNCFEMIDKLLQMFLKKESVIQCKTFWCWGYCFKI